jgi:hypothetical protein
MGNRVLAANPVFLNPFTDATEIEVTGRDAGSIAWATGYGSHGETVRRLRNKAGKVTDIWFAGANARPEKALAADIERRYARGKRRAKQ